MNTLLAILAWTLFGFVVGLLARALVPGRQALSLLQTTVLGIVGSLAGGLIAYAVNGGEPLQASGWIMSIVGAVIVLAIGISLMGRRRRTI